MTSSLPPWIQMIQLSHHMFYLYLTGIAHMYINIHTAHMFTDERLLSYVISNKESTSSGFGSKINFPGMASSMDITINHLHYCPFLIPYNHNSY